MDAPVIETPVPVTLDVRMPDFVDDALLFVQYDLLTVGFMVQIGLLALAVILGLLAGKTLTPRLSPRIDALNLPDTMKRVMRYSMTLLPYLSIMVLTALLTQIGQAGAVQYNVGVLDAVSKLLLAWVFIRVISLVIANPFIRKVLATAAWTFAALSILGILDDAAMMLDGFGVNLGEFRLSALTVLKGIFALLVLIYGAILISALIERKINALPGLNPASKVLITKIVKLTLIIFAVLTGITMSGIDLSLLAVFSGAVGLGIGFGLQRGISNLFTGMMLLMDRTIQPGDIIELPNGTFGEVNFMGSRQVEVITRDNRSFLIPNEDLVTNQVVNLSRGSPLVRLEVKFGVAYEHNPHEIRKLALEAVTKPERVLSDPPAACHFVEFGDSSLDFSLRFWIKDTRNGTVNVKSEVLLALWDIFEAHKIKIPYPQREVYVHKMGKQTDAA